MEALLVRDARKATAARSRRWTLSAYQEYAPLMPSLWDAYRDNIVTTLAAPEPATQIVAEQGSRIVGTVLLYPGGHRYRRTHAVSTPLSGGPAARRGARGAGQRHWRGAHARVHQTGAPIGATTLALHTTDLMRAAMRLYTRMGFQREPELEFRPDPR